MNDPKLELLIKEKMQKYIPYRPIQIMHGGVIVLASIAVGIFSLTSEQDAARNGSGAWLGIYLAVAGLVLYVVWTYLRIDKAKKEANAEFLAASPKNTKGK
jgi:high-affinity Fe2+/Pb2+ permease